MAVFTETIKLDDQVSGPAKKASAAMTDVGRKTLDAASAIAVGKATIAAAFAGIGDAAKSLAEGDVKGAVQGLTDSLAGMAKLLDLVVPGLGEAAAAVIQVAGGLVGITLGLIKSGVQFAIASSQAKEQMLTMFDALGEGKITGEQVDDMLDGLSAKLGQTKDVMIPLVQKFAAMGITSKDALEKMTTAALSAKALAGGAQSGADAFETLSKKIQLASETGQGLKIPIKGLGQLAAMGLTVEDVAGKMGISAKTLGEQLKAGTANASKFGDALQNALIEKGAGPLETMSLGAANLSAMFHQYIGDLFEDMSKDVKPFMLAIKDLFGIFDSKSKPSGEALKAGLGAFFKQVFAALTKVVPLVKHFLLDIVIYGLKAYIAVKPIAKAIADFAKSASGAKLISTVLSSLWTVLKAVGVVIGVVVVAVMALWTAMVVVSVAVWTLVGSILSLSTDAFGALADGLSDAVAAIYDFVSGAVDALVDWVSGAASAASDFVAGLISGISNGAGAVTDAVKGLADSATSAFTDALGISSPSKVMMELGGHTASGLAQGIEGGSDDVHGASSGLAGAAVKGASGSDAGASGGGKVGGDTNISVMVQVDGAGKSAQEITEEMVSQVFQRMALEAGV